MTKILTQSKLILGGIILASTLFACNDKKNNASTLPEFKGEITFDRDANHIGKGQKFSAEYTVPTGGKNIDPSDTYWTCDDKIESKGVIKDGVSTADLIADYELGEHKIAFVGQYLNIELGETQTKSKESKITVVACDVLTSFWGDSKALVLSTANEKFEDPKQDVLTAFVKNTIFDKDDEVRQYYFENDKLNKILRTAVEGAAKNAAVGYVNARAKGLELEGYTRVSYDVVDIATGAKTPIDMTKIKDVTYTTPISNDVENAKSELVVVLQNSKTTVIFSYKMREVGLILNTRTYMPR